MQSKNKLETGFKSYIYSFIYPFTQKDWLQKMWLFIAVSFVPVVSFLIVRGWRLEFIHRLGKGLDNPLPSPYKVFKYLWKGVVLWGVTALYLLVPFVIVRALGLTGLLDLIEDIFQIFGLFMDFMVGGRTFKEFCLTLVAFMKGEFLDAFFVALIENIYLIIYIPYYRTAMIRYALQENLLKSHFSVFKNLKFIFKNITDYLIVYGFGFLLIFLIPVVDILLTLTIIGIPLIPIVTVYMYYWSTGYEYGHLAQLMVEQENMFFESEPA